MIDEELPLDFDDHKEPGALRTIGEVSKVLGIKQHVLRYWEEQFPTLRPVKRSGGRRYYRPDDVKLLVKIDRLVHREGYTLRGARKAIESTKGRGEKAPKPVVVTQLPLIADVPAGEAGPSKAFLAELQAIRDDLAAALAA